MLYIYIIYYIVYKWHSNAIYKQRTEKGRDKDECMHSCGKGIERKWARIDNYGVMFDSMLMTSTAVGIWMACPLDDRAPRIDWIACILLDQYNIYPFQTTHTYQWVTL